MLTYGDMMTLLMTFFILITSYSTVELKKFREAMGSLQGALGILQSDFYVPGPHGQLTYRQNMLSHSLNEMDLQGLVEVTQTEKGVHFKLSSPVLFDLGKANLKPAVYGILSEIAEIMGEFPCEVVVEGHTDDIPIHTPQFPSNWELSAVRALSVVKHFAYQEEIPPAGLSAVGYGEYRPIAPNTTEEGRAKNRRVEIFVRWTDTASGDKETRGQGDSETED